MTEGAKGMDYQGRLLSLLSFATGYGTGYLQLLGVLWRYYHSKNQLGLMLRLYGFSLAFHFLCLVYTFC